MEKVKVGMGCTYVSGSDLYAFEVIKVIDEKTNHVIVREMDHQNKVNWPDQDYELTSDPNGRQVELQTFHGQLREVVIDPDTKKIHHLKRFWYSHYTLGRAEYYQDPSF